MGAQTKAAEQRRIAGSVAREGRKGKSERRFPHSPYIHLNERLRSSQLTRPMGPLPSDQDTWQEKEESRF
ncbi:hypothetical protein SESBI_39832 [Sesbania bispinosa]|nr:hypothetical protein SESBI_39832 [Sesbania bispinosa]